MKTYNILIYADFFSEYEIIKTNIPRNEIEHFIFMYENMQELEVDFFSTVKNAGYIFEAIASQDDIFIQDIESYSIPEVNRFSSSDYIMTICG